MALSELLDRGGPIHDRHVYVKEYDVEGCLRVGLDHVEGLLPVQCGLDRFHIRDKLEELLHHKQVVARVIYDKYTVALETALLAKLALGLFIEEMLVGKNRLMRLVPF